MKRKILIVTIAIFTIIFSYNFICAATKAEQANIEDYIGLFGTKTSGHGFRPTYTWTGTGTQPWYYRTYYANADIGLIEMLRSEHAGRVNYIEDTSGSIVWGDKKYISSGHETAYITEAEWQKMFTSMGSNTNGSWLTFKKYDRETLDELVDLGTEIALNDSALAGYGMKTKIKRTTMNIKFDDGSVLENVPRYYVLGTSTIDPVIITSSISFATNTINTYVDATDNFWADASSWFNKASSSGYETPEEVSKIIDEFTGMVNVIGTAVIIIATIVLGLKYMLGSVDQKSSVKENLITLFVACIFFFGWSGISNLLFPNNEFIFTSNYDTSYEQMVGRIFGTFTYIVQFVIVGIIIFVGVKYIFAGAEGKALLKSKSVYFLIGIILVFATTNVLTFISNIITDVLPS